MNDRKDGLAVHRLPSRRWREYLPLVLITAIGISISLAAFFSVRGVERVRVQDKLERVVANHAKALQQGLNNYLEVLQSIRGLYNASRSVERAEFSAFVANSVHRSSGLRALCWIPRVPHSRRNAYEAAARSEGFSDFAFTERTADGGIVKAAPREEYFPIYFVEPFKGNETALGFDAASDPVRWKAMKRARDTGTAVATGRIRLIQEADKQFGFVVYSPIYRKGAARETIAQRRESLVGYSAAMFSVGKLVESILVSLTSPAGFDIYLYDDGNGPGQRFLYFHPSRLHKQPPRPLTEEEVGAGVHWAKTIDVPGRRWKLLFRPISTDVGAQQGWQAWGVLVGGLTITMMLAAYLLISSRRAIEIQCLASNILKTATALEIQVLERKRAEDALRNSETLLRSFIDNSPSIIVLKDRNLRYKLVNKAFTRYHRVTVEEAVGKTAHDFFPKKYADWAIDHDRQVLDSRSVVHKEKEFPYDGDYRTNFQVKFPVLDVKGNLIGVGGIATDITERKRLEQALRLSEERFKDFAEAASDWFWEQDASLRFTHASPAVHEKSGVHASDHIGKTRRDIVELGVSDEQWRQHDADLAAHRPFRDFTFQRRDPTGQLRDFSVSGKPVFDTEGRFQGYRGVARDITERKHAEENFRALLESVPEAVIIVNEDGKIIRINAHTERMFGYNRQELIGRNVEKLMPVGARVRHRELRRDYCLDPQVRTMAVGQELVGVSKYNRKFPVEINLGPIRTDKGMLVSAIVRDITERKRAEDLHREAHKMEALGILAGGIAHDFNNALFPIIALTELTLGKLPRDSAEARHLEKVRSAAFHAQGLVRQILAFSRHEPLERRPIDLCPAVDEACELLRAGLPATVQIRKRLDEPLGLVLADPIQIRQVILNLGANAGDAMAEEGGILTVELSEVQNGGDNGKIESEPTPGRYVRVTVTDTGRGIDQDNIERIFDPFFTTKEVGQGTGLGLSVVHGIVKSHGGSMTVQSEAGKGSTFSVLFPVLEKSIDETGEPDLDTEGIGPCPEDRRNAAPQPRPNPSDRLQTSDRRLR